MITVARLKDILKDLPAMATVTAKYEHIIVVSTDKDWESGHLWDIYVPEEESMA